MFGNNIMILEDLSHVENVMSIDDFSKLDYIFGVALLISGVIVIYIIFKWMIGLTTEIECLDLDKSLDDAFGKEDQKTALINHVKSIQKYSAHQSSKLTYLLCMVGVVSFLFGIVILCIGYNLHTKDSDMNLIRHEYRIEINEEIPLDLLKTYDIVEWTDENICIIREREGTEHE